MVIFPSFGFKVAAYYWTQLRQINRYCTGSLSDFKLVTKQINPNMRHQDDRERRWGIAKRSLGCTGTVAAPPNGLLSTVNADETGE
jgi:predicted chitinase